MYRSGYLGKAKLCPVDSVVSAIAVLLFALLTFFPLLYSCFLCSQVWPSRVVARESSFTEAKT